MKCFFFLLLSVTFLISDLIFANQSKNVILLSQNEDLKTLHFIKKFLPSNPIIVEAGGYDGEDSVLMANIWPEGRIYTFEPVPELYERLKKNTQSLQNITTYQKALSDSNGYSTFYLSVLENDTSHVSPSSSLLVPKEHLKYAPNVYFPSEIIVETITLDDWIRQTGLTHIDFLWLDMQGYELHMLQASQFAKSSQAIWIEVEFIEAYKGQYLFKDIYQWMETHGFVLTATDFDLNNLGYRWSGNALFVKK